MGEVHFHEFASSNIYCGEDVKVVTATVLAFASLKKVESVPEKSIDTQILKGTDEVVKNYIKVTLVVEKPEVTLYNSQIHQKQGEGCKLTILQHRNNLDYGGEYVDGTVFAVSKWVISHPTTFLLKGKP